MNGGSAGSGTKQLKGLDLSTYQKQEYLLNMLAFKADGKCHIQSEQFMRQDMQLDFFLDNN